MARFARIVVPHLPHHVVQRGNRRQAVFFTDLDRWVYVRLLRTACRRYQVAIWAWCLMSNHVHVVAVPSEATVLGRCFADVHGRYARWVNARHKWQGHLWQERFGSSVMDERYLLAAVRYVERNPVDAGVVTQAWEYRWSSAPWHVGQVSRDPLVTGDEALRERIGDWRTYLTTAEEAETMVALEQDTLVSRPLGDEKFVRHIEHLVGHALVRGKPGRPRKENR